MEQINVTIQTEKGRIDKVLSEPARKFNNG